MKIICRADYDMAVELADMFVKMFGECIDIIDTLQINNEQAEAVEAAAQQMKGIKTFCQVHKWNKGTC